MANTDATECQIRLKCQSLRPILNEMARRWWASSRCLCGGVAMVARVTVTTVLHEVNNLEDAPTKRVRKSGGDCRRIANTDAHW